MNATWPFAKLRATAESIEITLRGVISSNEQFTFKKEDIVALHKRRGLFSVGLEIEHHSERYAPFILFWTFRFGRLKRNMEQLGFSIEE